MLGSYWAPNVWKPPYHTLSPGTHIVGPWVTDSIKLYRDLRTGTQYIGDWASKDNPLEAASRTLPPRGPTRFREDQKTLCLSHLLQQGNPLRILCEGMSSQRL